MDTHGVGRQAQPLERLSTAGRARLGTRIAAAALVPLWIAAAGCASSGGDLGTVPPVAPAPEVVVTSPSPVEKIAFPVHADGSGRYLVDANERPVLIHGDASWSLIVQLSPEDVDRYLAAREEQGVNTVVVNLIEHKFASRAPSTIDGIKPFTSAEDLATPNDAYFERARAVVESAARHGMLVMLAPAYAGYEGGDEGWFAALNRTPPSTCEQYGRYVASVFRGLDNVVWVHGGDYALPAGSRGEQCALAILKALRAELPGSMHLGHWARGSSSFDLPTFAGSFALNAVYTDDPARACVEQRRAHPSVPTFLFEARYENEHDLTAKGFRRQAWAAVLTCGAGEISGNRPVWLFDKGWQDALDSAGSRSMRVLAAVMGGVRWTELEPVPAGQLVTSDRGGLGEATDVLVAASADRSEVLAYIASGSSLTLDDASVAPSLKARWIDPTSGASTPFSLPAAKPIVLNTPGRNAGHESDWVLALEAVR